VGIQGKRLIAWLTALALYAVVLLLVYVLHARHFRVDVVFYSALADAMIAAAITAAALWVLPFFRVLDPLDRAQTLLVCLLGGYAFAISVPTVIDRSLSFYLLEKLDSRGGGIRLESMESVVSGEFMQEYRVVDARLTEQLESGTIIIEDHCVLLTAKGKRIARLSRSFREQFLPRQRQLLGSYSDELTRPLKNDHDVNYRCAAPGTQSPP
jgi:hypothetical protein